MLPTAMVLDSPLQEGIPEGRKPAVPVDTFCCSALRIARSAGYRIDVESIVLEENR